MKRMAAFILAMMIALCACFAATAENSGATPPEAPQGGPGGTPPEGTPPDGFGGGTPPDGAPGGFGMPVLPGWPWAISRPSRSAQRALSAVRA